ncbi:Hemerythrin domain-containing protein [Pseudozyma hubeiensis]|nr:Hemerythrin domain-containing protein [Pseudozyma hubeiensis]
MSDPWDCLYRGMLPFHQHFRHATAQISTLLLQLSPTSPPKPKLQILTNLLYLCSSLCSSLETHHAIEERFIFPTLAKKLPQFAHSSQHTKEHAQMHSALENLEHYVAQVSKDLRSGKIKKAEELDQVFDYAKMTKLVEELKSVLLPHLEAEEASLRAPVVKAAGFELGEIKNLIR